ncbi:MAG: CHAT domain-containing protein [Cyanobacteria bacterium J06629_19]
MEKHLPQSPCPQSSFSRSVARAAKPFWFPVTWLASLVAAFFPTAHKPAQAQVIPTAEGAGTTVTTTGDQYDIAGGTQAGGNLFHEFDEFSVEAAQTANFMSDSGVFNIVGQVSAENPSYIDGTVQVSGSDADLYLINPSGVLFGPDAQLSLSGSFTAATADQVEFTGEVLNVLDQGEDYSSFTGDPSAFHFTEDSASAVVNQGELAVAPGESISLIGGSVVNTGEISAPGGEVGLVAVGGESTVRYDIPGSLLSLEMTQRAVPGGSGFSATELPALITGSKTPVANDLWVMPDGTVMLRNIPVDSKEVAVTGEISAQSTEEDGGAIALLGNSIDVLDAVVDASGNNGGNIRIGGDFEGQNTLPTADTVLVNSSSTIRADGFGGAGGEVAIWSDDRAYVRGELSAQGAISGGLIETSAAQLNLGNLTVNASGQAEGGGRWLIDPVDIDIVSSSSGFNQIETGLIESTLDSGTDVAITTSTGTGGNGDIFLLDSVDQNGGGSASLTLTGRRFDTNGATIDLSSTGQLTFDINQVNAEATPDSSSIEEAIDAIGDVSGSRRLRLGAGDYGFTSIINIDTNVEIEGAGASNTALTTLVGGTRVFQVNAGVEADIRNVTITTAGLGANEVGGGITNRGTLSIDSSHFVDNRATQNGGAIDSFFGGATVISNSEFRDNRSAVNGSGGAIHIGGSAGVNRISNTVFENNYSPNSGGAVNVGNARLIIDSNSRFTNNTARTGGALRASGGSLTELDTVTFGRNSSTELGGAAFVGGGGSATLSNSTFTNNESVSGGAIAIVAAGVTDTDSTFTHNRATGSGTEGNGGAIHIGNNGRLSSTGASFTENTAEGNGGAIAHNATGQTLTIQSASFTENISQKDGGAVFAGSDTTTTVANSSFSANRAEGTSSHGGALAIVSGGNLSLTHTVVDSNESTMRGGGLYVDSDGTAAITGTLAIDSNGIATSATTRFVNNQAGKDGGGIAMLDESVLTISNALFRGNYSGDDGGGIAVTELSQSTIDNVNFENNTVAENGGGLYSNNILFTAPTDHKVVLSDSRFINNEAGQNGGGFYQGNNGSATVQSSLFQRNNATIDGGGVHVATDSMLAITGATYEGNQAVNGGALSNFGSTELVNTTVSGNTASRAGGAIKTAGAAATLSVRNSTITNNQAGTAGGGIAEASARLTHLQSTIVAANRGTTADDVSGSFVDDDNNLIGSSEGATGFTRSRLVGSAARPINPRLAPLANNGGPTKTHLLLANSPAIDTGSTMGSLAVDQRGAVRFSGSAVDIGAVELSEIETPDIEIPDIEIPEGESEIPHESFPQPTLSTTAFSELDLLLSVRTRHELDDAEVSIQQLERTFSQGFEDYWDLSAGPDLTFSEVQAVLRRAQEEYKVNSAVIYAIFAPEDPDEADSDTVLQVDPTPADDDLLNLSVVLPEGELVSYQLPVTRKEAARQVRYFRSTVSDLEDASGYRPLAQQLYQWLLAPLEEELAAQNVQNLMYALDTGLRTVPITAMRDYEGFSLERYGISVVPSMGLMQADFPAPVRRSTVAMGVSEFASESPLPAVPIELQVVDQFVPVSQTVLNEATTLDAVKNVQALEQPGILHLATHASFDRRSPEDSYIHLWNDDLSMREFSQLDWQKSDLELLILSACSTALGSRNSELGFAGLAAASGVDATVGSLWEVSDIGTLALMSEFYAQLEETDLRFEALRRAQLSLLKGETRIEGGNLITGHGEVALPAEWNLPDSATLDHPFFWSAFTMVGNPW